MDDKGNATTDLEREFEKVAKDVTKQIVAKMKEAHASLDEAVAISKRHGIPFYATISPLSQMYVPGSYQKKFRGLDENFVESVLEIWPTLEYGGSGWEHSAVC